MPFYPGSNGGGTGTVTEIVAGNGINGGTITTSGTVSLDVIGGSNVTITNGNTISSSGGGGGGGSIPISNRPLVTSSSAVAYSASASAFAIKGNRITARETLTLTGLSLPLGGLVSGGSYTAFLAFLNSGSIVSSVVNTDTMVASTTGAAEILFTLSSPTQLVPNDQVAVFGGRIDSAGTFALPLIGGGTTVSTGLYPGCDSFVTNARLAGTVVSVGTTIDVAGTVSPFMVGIFGRLGT